MRRRVLLVTIASAALVAVAFAVPLGGLVRNIARDRALSAAEQDAAALAPVLAVTEDPFAIEAAIAGTATGADGRLAVITPDNVVLGGTPADDGEIIEVIRSSRQRFSVDTGQGINLYVPMFTGAGDLSIIRAVIPQELLGEGVTLAWLALTGVALGLIVLSAVVADRLARSMTHDAHQLAGTARRLAGGDETARAPGSQTTELDTLSRALNHLGSRIDALRTVERERIADLSHRLRTPLTALRLDADALGDPLIVGHAARLEAAVTELITTARRPLTSNEEPVRCDAVAILADRADFWAPLADDDERPWTIDIPDQPATVACRAGELGDALDNVLGNIFTHTPPGTPYRITAAVIEDDHGQQSIAISIIDEGPGFDTTQPLRRGETTSSTGLGLSISRRVVEAANGRLEAQSNPNGIGGCVVLTLPLRTDS